MPRCQLCKRDVEQITVHHLIPKQKGGTSEDTINLCLPCHKTIHAYFTNTELVQEYNTLQKLRDAERLHKYLKWIAKRSIESLKVRRKK
jgi:5-methylcytosine-specific restriction endonuclease McrA